MARTSRNLGFTVPPRMAEEFERVAEEEGSTKSELFRRMFRLYQSYRTPTGERAPAPEAWVERLILEAQDAERRAPLSAQEYGAALQRAQRYGRKRAKALGLTPEKDLDRVLDGKPPSR
jgi:hypothetical protein